jgi:transposase
MVEGGSLINLGDLSKPSTVLIEKVCNAVGIIYEPTRIRRQARAEVDADKIKALARIELSDLERRALERLVHQEARRQANIEQIIAQAASALPSDAKVETLDEDWIAHFFK